MQQIYYHELTVPKEAEDQNGHVNNVEYLRWVQDAAMQHSEKAGCTKETSTAVETDWVFVDTKKGTLRSIPKEVKASFELLPEGKEADILDV